MRFSLYEIVFIAPRDCNILNSFVETLVSFADSILGRCLY